MDRSRAIPRPADPIEHWQSEYIRADTKEKHHEIPRQSICQRMGSQLRDAGPVVILRQYFADIGIFVRKFVPITLALRVQTAGILWLIHK
ncbi:hypothetical protein JHW40_21890 (plasmid) [Paracoccus alcaliphilus]|nr:hypothetical protein JHW40_21890 [Paracoccus alcaliphilus]